MAELAEGTSRHRSGIALTRRAVESVFSDRRSGDPDVAIARAWLAERLRGTVEEFVSEDKIALARMQALTSPAPTDPGLAAMLAEVAGRSSENLILLSESELERLRAKSKGAALIETYAWCAAASGIPFLLALIFLKPVLGWFGNSDPRPRPSPGLRRCSLSGSASSSLAQPG